MMQAKNYWQHRLNSSIYSANVPKLERQVLKLYKMAGKSIQRDLTKVYLMMLEDGGVNAANLFKMNRYRGLQQAIAKEVMKIAKTETALIGGVLFNAYKETYTGTSKRMGGNTSWSILNEHNARQTVMANFKGANYSDRIWNNKAELSKLLEKSITDSVIAGRSKDKAVADVMKRFGVGFNDADRLIRTETQRVLNEAQRQTYKDRGYNMVNWLVADDERLCDECMGIGADGPYPIDEVPAVAHPNCRCTIIPVLPTFD